jgi:hypothetical protein
MKFRGKWMKTGCHSVLKYFSLIIVNLIALVALIGCATSQEPLKKERGTFMQRAQTKRQAHLEVTVAIPSESEAEDLFSAPLSEKGIQPIWIRIKNYENRPHMFLPLLVDQNYYPPYEVVYKFKHSKNQDWYTEIKQKSIHHFIEPLGEISGYIFTNMVHGTRRISVGVIGHGILESFVFYIQDPGIELDYEKVDFDHLYPVADRTDLNETNFRSALETLPCCTTNSDGSINGDPLNIVIIGEVEQVVEAFIDNGWDETELLTRENMIKAAKAFLSGSSYRHTIISPLYCFGRQQDLSMQKPRKTISARNHLRLWMTSMLYKGRPVWIGQISRDVGVRMTFKTWPPFTHKISPTVDEAREYLVENMVISNTLAEFGFVGGVGAAPYSEPRENLTGDPYFTDGLRAVFVLSEKPTPINQIKLLKWDWPPEYKDLADWIFKHKAE